jgi:hypothetical protein
MQRELAGFAKEARECASERCGQCGMVLTGSLFRRDGEIVSLTFERSRHTGGAYPYDDQPHRTYLARSSRRVLIGELL